MPSSIPIGKPFIELLTVDSTNNYAMGMVHAGMAQHATAVFTHEQTKGKGQRNRSWSSAGKQNIAISFILTPQSSMMLTPFLLSKTVALGVMEFYRKYAGDETTIKWPNDIYWRDRKAAGILIENVWQGNVWKYAVSGIGINVNQVSFEGLDGRAVSLKQVTGKDLEPLQLAQELCSFINAEWDNCAADPENIVHRYKKNLYKLHMPVRFKKDNRIFSAVVKDVTPDGLLHVTHATDEFFAVGEVEWLP